MGVLNLATLATIGSPGEAASATGSAYARTKALGLQTFGTQNPTLVGTKTANASRYRAGGFACSPSSASVWTQALAAVPATGLLVTTLWLSMSANQMVTWDLAVGAAGAETLIASVRAMGNNSGMSDYFEVPVFIPLNAGERIAMRCSITAEIGGTVIVP